MTTAVSSYESLGLASASQRVKKNEIGQDDFLKLMTTQLQAQDPFKPMDSSQFLGQIAQFSQVSGLQALNTSFANLASSLSDNQTLQGASLVGREVLAASDRVTVAADGGAEGAIVVPQAGWLTLELVDASGQTVRQLDLGKQPAGVSDFSWDGLDANGAHVAAGNYSLRASLRGDDGSNIATSTYVSGLVRGVAPSNSGLQLDVAGLGSLSLSQVARIQ